MKIAILASSPNLYSNKRCMAVGEERGHQMRFIHLEQCYMDIMHKNPVVFYRGGEELKDFDAIIPRFSTEKTFYGAAVLRQFSMRGVYTLNGPISISRARDKLRTLQILSREKDIHMPRTCFADSTEDTAAIVKMVGGAPVVVKLLEGTHGAGVFLAEDAQKAEALIQSFKQFNAKLLVQEFIKESFGTDVRCFVVGNKVVAAMERHAPEGEFRANIHLGAVGVKTKLSAEERKMAITAAREIGLQVAGVDLIRSHKGPLVLEVNASPGLEGIEKASGKDIASLMLAHIEQYAVKDKQPKLREG